MQIIHFSDIHFKSQDNALINKSSKLFDVIKNELSEDAVLLVSGDSAYSGTKEEFEISYNFLSGLINQLEEYSKVSIKLAVIPGNHDCQDLIKNDPVRKSLLDTIQKSSELPEIEIVNSISKNLQNYYSFEEICNVELDNLYSSELLKVYFLENNSKTTLLYCFNTAYQSIINEAPGKMIFPIDLIDQDILQKKADLKLALFHHPFNWLNPENSRKFRNHVEQTYDFYITGHEHVSSRSAISDLEDNWVYHIEGDVLQDSYDPRRSGFNLINLNLDQGKFLIKNFKWNGEKYTGEKSAPKEHLFKRGATKVATPFQIRESFKDKLNDIGANFSHPNVSNLNLSDIYVYPNVELLNQVEDDQKDVTTISIDTRTLIENFTKDIRIIFSGSENIGKTALLKTCYQKLYNKNLIPILIDGNQIKSTSPEDLITLFKKRFLEQYVTEDLEDFIQLDKNKLVIIIDDFNRVKINLRYRARLLQNLISHYPNIIISGNELMSLEDIITDENEDTDLYSSFKLYELKEFGYLLRSKLINNWNILGVEHSISEEERIKKLQHCETVINTVTGINFVPSYPLFLLTILQSIELGNPTDLSASTFGHYYQFLIQKSFKNILNSQREITEYENFLSELSYYLYDNSLREIDTHEFEKFYSQYNFQYTITHNQERITENLIKAKIVDSVGGVLEYKYSYIHYYFLSNFIASHIGQEKIKNIIIDLTNGLHRSENSNILMFLTHHTKDAFLLTRLLEKAKSLFVDLAPSKLEEDIKSINKLGEKIPKLVFESRSVDEYRDQENKLKDQDAHLRKIEEDEQEQEHEIDIVARLNTSFKSLEIIGQILKNNYGKIENNTIENLLEESILLGLRTLNVFFTIIEENSEFVINQVNSIIAEIEKSRGKKIDNPKKIENLSKSTLFGLCNQISYSFIKKISDSIGTEYLKNILEKVYQKQDYNSVKLIKLAIKLDHFTGFPDSDIKRLKKEFDGAPLPSHIMKRLVINHLYLFPTNHKQKSRILSLLDVPIQTQLKIDQTSKQKKRSVLK